MKGKNSKGYELVGIAAVGAILILSVLISGCVETQDKNNNTSNTNNNIDNKPDGNLPNRNISTVKTFTLDDVSKHNSQQDCWMAIHNKVYDVTEYVNSKYAMPITAQYCGKEATDAFETKVGVGKTPTHSDRARKMLESYYIGDLM